MRRSLSTILTTGVISTGLFYLAVHLLAGVWLDLTLRPELRRVVEESLPDQKSLSELDPARADEYRERFEANQALLNRIDVVMMNRERMLRRFEILMVGCFALMFALGGSIWWRRQRAIEERARGAYVERLRSWQDASRRHAHEIRTPLTAARMETERLLSAAERGDGNSVRETAGSIFDELDRIASFTRQFSSFATIAQPVLHPHSIREILEEFCLTFARAWPSMSLHITGAPAALVLCDRDLLRQVLVNLATNGARAIEDSGTLTLSAERKGELVLVDVEDSGCGIPDGVRARVFEPYVTTREVGEGMGLGLSIARKILLDHGGDLQLLRTSAEGTVFRLVLRVA